MKLLNVGHNAKTIKSDKLKKFLTGILYLAPAKTSGFNTCVSHTKACSDNCLFYAGFGRYTKIRQYRINKTLMFFNDRQKFISLLEKDLQSLITKCEKLSIKPAVRLNGTSDLGWEKLVPHIFTNYQQITFYSYTKVKNRYQQFLDGKLPSNSYYVFSRSEKNENDCIEFLNKGGSVAVVGFKRPKVWQGFKTIDGDRHDLIFTLPRNRVIWLKPKGLAKKDTSNFVIR